MEKSKKRGNYKKRGNPFRRGKTWTFYYYMPDKRLRYKGGYKNHASAKTAMKYISSLVILGQFNPNDRITVVDFAVNWFEGTCAPSLAYSSQKTYANALYNYIIPHFGKTKLQTINRASIICLLNSVSKKSPTVAKIVKTIMNGIIEAAIEEKLLLRDPTYKVRLSAKPTEQREKISLTVEEVGRLLEAAKGSSIELEILLAYSLGVRKGELLGLKFSDVDYKNKQIHVQRTLDRDNYDLVEYEKRKSEKTLTKAEKNVKTETSNRFVPVSQITLDLIRKREIQCIANRATYGDRYNNEGYICCTKYGNPRSKDSHWKPFKKVLQQAQLPDIRWHDLRHLNATHLFSKGVNPKAISRALGHTRDVTTSNVYIATDLVEREAVDAVAAFLCALKNNQNAS